MHGGVEAVPAELVLQAVGAQPRAVAIEHRAHGVAGTLGDLDRDARAQEVGILGGEAELAQHLRQRALERGLVGEALAHRGVQFRGGPRLGHVVEVDVVRLGRAAELGAQERGQARAHRVVEQLDEQPFHVLFRDLAREVELARDGARRLRVVRVEAARHLGVGQEVAVALGAHGVGRRDRRAAHGVARGVPRGAARGAFHHGAGDAAVDRARHHPHEGMLLVEAVGVAVAGLDLLAHQPVGKQRAVGLEPALALRVDHRAHRHMEARDEVLRLVPDAAGVVGEFRRDARPEALRDARGGPVVDRPAVALGEHPLQVRPVEVEERDERDLLLVELVAQVGRGVKRGDRLVEARELVAREVVPAPQRAAHLVEVALDLADGFLQSVEEPRACGGIGREVPRAEGRERGIVAVGRLPARGAAGHALLRGGTDVLAVGCDDRVDGRGAIGTGNDGRGGDGHGVVVGVAGAEGAAVAAGAGDSAGQPSQSFAPFGRTVANRMSACSFSRPYILNGA